MVSFAFEEESDEDNKIYFSDLYVSQDVFQQSRLVFLFSSHSEARAAFQSVVNEQGWRLTNQHGTVYLSCVHEGPLLTIQNLLQVPSDAFTWETLVSMTESFARSRFVDQILWEMTRNPIMDQWFVGRGYGRVTHRVPQATGLPYSFRPRWRRRPWRLSNWRMASAEKHGIIFEWVAGTSVGALNGALVLMDDIEAAEQLWTNISSEQVLQYPKAAAKKKPY